MYDTPRHASSFAKQDLLPPSNQDAERSLLGALLANNRSYEEVSEFLLPEHFADHVHARIFKEAVRIIEAGGVADAVTLKSRFENAGVLDEVGGVGYLADLLTSMVATKGAPAAYGRAVYDAWLRRKLISIGQDTASAAFGGDPAKTAEDLLEESSRRITELAVHGMKSGRSATAAEAVRFAREQGERAMRGEGPVALSTGILSMDTGLVGGLFPGHMIVVAGRPGMGKTSLADSVATNVAAGLGVNYDDQSRGRPVLMFRMEGNEADAGAGLIARLAGVPKHTTMQGRWTTEEAGRVLQAETRLANTPLEMVWEPRLSLTQAVRIARQVRRKYGDLALIVVDYLQRMAKPKGITEERISVNENIYGLVSLGQELGCTMMVLSQLSRQVENRQDKRPSLGDLRESGAIEDAADVALFPFREAYYYKQTQPTPDPGENETAFQSRLDEWQEHLNLIEEDCDLDFLKVRHGEAPVRHRVRFNQKCNRFEERGR